MGIAGSFRSRVGKRAVLLNIVVRTFGNPPQVHHHGAAVATTVIRGESALSNLTRTPSEVLGLTGGPATRRRSHQMSLLVLRVPSFVWSENCNGGPCCVDRDPWVRSNLLETVSSRTDACQSHRSDRRGVDRLVGAKHDDRCCANRGLLAQSSVHQDGSDRGTSVAVVLGHQGAVA